MKWKAIVPIAIILTVLALTLILGADIEENPPRPRVDCNMK